MASKPDRATTPARLADRTAHFRPGMIGYRTYSKPAGGPEHLDVRAVDLGGADGRGISLSLFRPLPAVAHRVSAAPRRLHISVLTMVSRATVRLLAPSLR